MRNAEEPKKPTRGRELRGLGSFGTLGLEIVLSILFGLFVGTKLDEWLNTKPWMSVLWFAFGCVAAGRSVYRTWKNMQAVAKREEAEQGNPAQAFPDEKSLAWKREEREEEERAREEEEERAGKNKGTDAPPLEKSEDVATKERE